MDYEKAYKAVLKTATQWIKDGCTDKEKICLECVFPELRESEDERIRKALVEYHKQQFENNRDQEIGLFHKDAIAYLEKQKEQKEIPLMNGDADLYFDNWRQEVSVPTFRQCFEEGMRYAQKLQKEQKPAEWSEEDEINIGWLISYLKGGSAGEFDDMMKESLVSWLKSLRPSWMPNEEQIVNATFNDLAEVYERIRTEMLRRHRDIAINIKEGQQ